jgi:hypothetical protein
MVSGCELYEALACGFCGFVFLVPGKHEVDALLITGIAPEELPIGIVLSGPGETFSGLLTQGAICLRPFVLVYGQVWSPFR